MLRDQKKTTIGPKFDPSQFEHIATRRRTYGQSLNVRQKLGRPKEDKMDQIKNHRHDLEKLFDCVHEGQLFMSEQTLEENVIVTRNKEVSEIRPWFSITQMDEKVLWSMNICFQVIDSSSIRLFGIGGVPWRQNCTMSTICKISD